MTIKKAIPSNSIENIRILIKDLKIINKVWKNDIPTLSIWSDEPSTEAILLQINNQECLLSIYDLKSKVELELKYLKLSSEFDNFKVEKIFEKLQKALLATVQEFNNKKLKIDIFQSRIESGICSHKVNSIFGSENLFISIFEQANSILKMLKYLNEKSKSTPNNYSDFDELFLEKYRERKQDFYTILFNEKLIDENKNYNTGFKGAFCVWVQELNRQPSIIKFCHVDIWTKLLNKKFPGLKMSKDSFRKLGMPTEKKYSPRFRKAKQLILQG